MTEHEIELTRLAAKAAGIQLEPGTTRIAGTMQTWRPLTDDGDALRLAVKFKMSVHSGTHSPSGIEFVYAQVRATKPCQEYNLDDRDAATRRAIVRAAAEIGKQMELNT